MELRSASISKRFDAGRQTSLRRREVSYKSELETGQP